MENALVVEDEQNVARICVRLLESMGMTSVVVATGQEAMAVISSNAPLAFAYVDVGLPDGSGLNVAAQARQQRPTLPIVIATGLLEEIDSGTSVVLRKPFTLDQFRAAVRAAKESAQNAAGGAPPA